MRREITINDCVGIAIDTNDCLFGIQISRNLPGTLLIMGIGPVGLYVVLNRRLEENDTENT